MLKGRIGVVRRMKSDKGGDYHVYKVGLSDIDDVDKVEKYVCSLTYQRSTQTFKMEDNVDSLSDYVKRNILAILGSKEFIDCLKKFKYDNRVTYKTFYVSNSFNVLMEDISKEWSEY